MATLLYSFAQLEAFTAVAEHGSLMKAAGKLGKDRTTLRDLIDFLEDGLGYALFERELRTLRLTPEGEQLRRQAHLLMRQLKAFEAVANELEMLRGLLEQGCGWGFLPTHLQATQWKNVKRLHTEVGSQGISQTMVTIWKPGSDKRGTIDRTLSLLPTLWQKSLRQAG